MITKLTFAQKLADTTLGVMTTGVPQRVVVTTPGRPDVHIYFVRASDCAAVEAVLDLPGER